ncbi:MAG: oligosaccharide flippase family protein [Candidatus Rokubacteria bacterium]|nr:oligosaccharide flippase family protein [Candidatus Rokubacteria bacterium]
MAFAATFFIPVVLVRIFAPAEFGTYKQLFLICATLYGIAQVGMAESLFYFLPSGQRDAARYVVNSMLVLAAAGLACLGLLELGGSAISHWLSNSELAPHLPFIGIYLLLLLVSAVLEIVMISRQRYFLASSSYALFDVLRAVLFLIPALLLRRLEWLILGGVVSAALRFCAVLLYLRREFHGELKPDAALLKEQVAYALPFQLWVLVEIVQANFHQYAVSYGFDAATFAIYAVGCFQIPAVDWVTTSAGNVMMVRMSEKIGDGQRESVPGIWRDVTRNLALIFFPLVGLLLVAAPELIVFLFTETYRASVPLFMIWSAALVLAAFQTDAALRVYAETRFLFGVSTLRLVLITGLIGGFLSAFHMLGAVLVTVLAMVVGKVLALARIKRLLGVGVAEFLPWRSLAAIVAVAAAAGAVALGVKSQMELSTLPVLVTTSLVYAASYAGLSWWLGLFGETGTMVVTRWLQRPSVGPAQATGADRG